MPSASPRSLPRPAPATRLPPVTVFAAASLSDSLAEIARAFEATHPGTPVILNFAGSQKLLAQLRAGATGDVFVAADLTKMREATDAGLVDGRRSRVFASNRLVLACYAKRWPADATVTRLAQPRVSLVLAHPSVPAGAYAREALARLGDTFSRAAQENVVSLELSARAVLTKVVLGEADAGIVYETDLHGVDHAKVHSVPLPAEVQPRIEYTVAPLKAAPNPTGADAFARFLLSEKAQSLLRRHGFLPAPATP